MQKWAQGLMDKQVSPGRFVEGSQAAQPGRGPSWEGRGKGRGWGIKYGPYFENNDVDPS